jgi:hypothetical protein
MTVPSEGTNVNVAFDYYVDTYIEVVTSAPDDKKGASHKPFKSKDVGTISTQKGTSKLGAHVTTYRPELMAILVEGL